MKLDGPIRKSKAQDRALSYTDTKIMQCVFRLKIQIYIYIFKANKALHSAPRFAFCANPYKSEPDESLLSFAMITFVAKRR